MTTIQLLGALGLGLALGYVMQRPQICFNRAYRTSTLQADTSMLKSLSVAMLIQLVGFHTLVELGIVSLNIVPGIWLAALVGGFAFGLSFVFAQGCSTTMWYRLGNGNLGSLLTRWRTSYAPQSVGYFALVLGRSVGFAGKLVDLAGFPQRRPLEPHWWLGLAGARVPSRGPGVSSLVVFSRHRLGLWNRSGGGNRTYTSDVLGGDFHTHLG
jgi:hypothetical protein